MFKKSLIESKYKEGLIESTIE